MTTGNAYANITNKRLMSYIDFKDRMLDYLSSLYKSIVSRIYLNGSFDEISPLSSPGANQVQIDLKTILGDGFVHDGIGNILDLALITRYVPFENTNGVLYEVGAGYIDIPSGIQVNPRTGLPEYIAMEEGIGEQSDPSGVIDNGDGTLTFNVDSVTESGVTNVGRTVRVFKKVPDRNALTEAEAIEECTVFYAGGSNSITTVSNFGQETVSTTVSDYTVQLEGISVKREASHTILNGNFFYCGTVLGNGSTPTVFDTSGQNILKSQSAYQIAINPFTGPSPLSWDISSTDVQAALEEIISDLSQTTPSATHTDHGRASPAAGAACGDARG